jgi:hypothetical protein
MIQKGKIIFPKLKTRQKLSVKTNTNSIFVQKNQITQKPSVKTNTNSIFVQKKIK